MTVLILGGTAEARALAAALDAAGVPVVSSLAGRVTHPARPVGQVRVGGFGGATGLTDYLRTSETWAVVDATHPFAAQISHHAVAAAQATGVPLLRLARPGWAGHPQAGGWTWVPDVKAARDASDWSQRPFLTTGRQSLAAFAAWSDRAVLARVVDPPEIEIPEPWTVILSRGPYALADERRLMSDHGVDVLLTKDSGGRHTEAKLDAAAALGVPVVIIARPTVAPAPATVDDVDAAVVWVLEAVARR